MMLLLMSTSSVFALRRWLLMLMRMLLRMMIWVFGLLNLKDKFHKILLLASKLFLSVWMFNMLKKDVQFLWSGGDGGS